MLKSLFNRSMLGYEQASKQLDRLYAHDFENRMPKLPMNALAASVRPPSRQLTIVERIDADGAFSLLVLHKYLFLPDLFSDFGNFIRPKELFEFVSDPNVRRTVLIVDYRASNRPSIAYREASIIRTLTLEASFLTSGYVLRTLKYCLFSLQFLVLCLRTCSTIHHMETSNC